MSQNKIDFQPMPKRFMVWDKKRGEFIRHLDTEVFDLYLLSDILDTYTSIEYYKDLAIFQSTNLFDKDGEEIFEGSIVDFNGNGCVVGCVRQHIGQWYLETKVGALLLLECRPRQKVIGHILTNPELLEEK